MQITIAGAPAAATQAATFTTAVQVQHAYARGFAPSLVMRISVYVLRNIFAEPVGHILN